MHQGNHSARRRKGGFSPCSRSAVPARGSAPGFSTPAARRIKGCTGPGRTALSHRAAGTAEGKMITCLQASSLPCANLSAAIPSRAGIASRQRRDARQKPYNLSSLDSGGCRIGQIRSLLLTMKSDAAEIRRKVAAHRARQIAAGRIALTTYVPTDLLAQIDKIKEQRGVPGRAPIIEEALRFYIEQQQGT